MVRSCPSLAASEYVPLSSTTSLFSAMCAQPFDCTVNASASPSGSKNARGRVSTNGPWLVNSVVGRSHVGGRFKTAPPVVCKLVNPASTPIRRSTNAAYQSSFML